MPLGSFGRPCSGRWRSVAQRRVWPDGVVVDAPAFSQHAQLCPLLRDGRNATRLLIHVGTFNLSLLLRKMLGAGTPRELKNRAASLVLRFFEWLACRYRPNGTVEFSITPVLTSPPPTAPADHDVSPSGIQPLAPRADSPTASATPEASFKRPYQNCPEGNLAQTRASLPGQP